MSTNTDIETRKPSESIVALDELRLRQVDQKTRDQHTILQQDEAMNSSNLFSIIFFFLKSFLDPENKITPEQTQQFSKALGFDASDFSKTMSDYKSGEVGRFETAKKLYNGVDKENVDLDGAVRAVSGGKFAGLNDLPPSGDANFKSALEFTLKEEGGWNPNEPDGGYAKFGINSNANADIDIKSLTLSDAAVLYKDRYWDKVDGIENMDARAAMVVFDLAVNSGVGRANEFLSALEKEGKADLETGHVDIDAFMQKRADFLDGLVEGNPAKYAKYENGWDNRLDRLTAAAKDMPAEGHDRYQHSAAERHMESAHIGAKSGAMIMTTEQKLPHGGLFAQRPLDTTMTSDFGPRSLGMHRGIDLRTKSIDANGHVPLHARQDMVITNISTNPGGYGHRVSAAIGTDDQGRAITVQFSHLKELPTHIEVGSTVKAGEYIATTGTSGRGTGAHLDFEVRIGAQVVDPVKAFTTDLSNSANGDLLIENARQVLGAKANSGTYASRIAPALERESVMTAINTLDSNRESIMMAQFNNGGILESDPAQPTPLVYSFDGIGVNQIALAASAGGQLGPVAGTPTPTSGI